MVDAKCVSRGPVTACTALSSPKVLGGPIVLFVLAIAQAAPSDYCKIVVRDAETGRGVPLVELRTTNELIFYTDSNGIVAFNEPGLMDRDVYFQIASPGYQGFGRTVPIC